MFKVLTRTFPAYICQQNIPSYTLAEVEDVDSGREGLRERVTQHVLVNDPSARKTNIVRPGRPVHYMEWSLFTSAGSENL